MFIGEEMLGISHQILCFSDTALLISDLVGTLPIICWDIWSGIPSNTEKSASMWLLKSEEKSVFRISAFSVSFVTTFSSLDLKFLYVYSVMHLKAIHYLKISFQASFGLVLWWDNWHFLVKKYCHLCLALLFSLRSSCHAIFRSWWFSSDGIFIHSLKASFLLLISSTRVCSDWENQSVLVLVCVVAASLAHLMIWASKLSKISDGERYLASAGDSFSKNSFMLSWKPDRPTLCKMKLSIFPRGGGG